MKVLNKLLPVVAALSLAACVGGNNTGTPSYVPGGGSGTASFGSAISGQFVDAPVNGLNYWLNGDTNNKKRTSGKGNFSCNVGDFVTFALGNLELGTGPCGTIVTPDLIQSDDSDAADTIMVLLQSLGGGASASLLNVSAFASQPVASAIPNITGATEGQVNALFTAASKPTVTLATAQASARAAHTQYMQSINSIPDSWVGKVFYSEIVKATLVSGNSSWCDRTAEFHIEVFAYKDQAGVKRGGFEVYGVEDVDAENAVAKGEIYSKNIYTSFRDESMDSDEVYQITGSASLTEAGVMTGSWVETTLETDAGDEQYIGTKCAYKFGPIKSTVSAYGSDN